MSNLFPRPDLQLGSSEPAPVDGVVLDNRPVGTGSLPWSVSFHGVHLTGAQNVEPLRVENINTNAVISTAGLMPPGRRPSVRVSSTPGLMTGDCRFAIRKYRSQPDEAWSDFSPQFPNPGKQVNLNEGEGRIGGIFGSQWGASQFLTLYGQGVDNAVYNRWLTAYIPMFATSSGDIFIEGFSFYARFLIKEGGSKVGVFTAMLYTADQEFKPVSAVAGTKISINIATIPGTQEGSQGDERRSGFDLVSVTFPTRAKLSGARYVIAFFGGDPDAADTATAQSYLASNGAVQIQGAQCHDAVFVQPPSGVLCFGDGSPYTAQNPPQSQFARDSRWIKGPSAVVAVHGYSGRVASVTGPKVESYATADTSSDSVNVSNVQQVQTTTYTYQVWWSTATGPKEPLDAAFTIDPADPSPDSRRESLRMKEIVAALILDGEAKEYRVFDFAFTTDDADGDTAFSFLTYSAKDTTLKPRVYHFDMNANVGVPGAITSNDVKTADATFTPEQYIVRPENFSDQYVFYYAGSGLSYHRFYKSTDGGVTFGAVQVGPRATVLPTDWFVLDDTDTEMDAISSGGAVNESEHGRYFSRYATSDLSGFSIESFSFADTPSIWPSGGSSVRLGKGWFNPADGNVYVSFRTNDDYSSGSTYWYPRLARFNITTPGIAGGVTCDTLHDGLTISGEFNFSGDVVTGQDIKKVDFGPLHTADAGVNQPEIYVQFAPSENQSREYGNIARSYDDGESWYSTNTGVRLRTLPNGTVVPQNTQPQRFRSQDFAVCGLSGRFVVEGGVTWYNWGYPPKETQAAEIAPVAMFHHFFRDSAFVNPIKFPLYDSPNTESIWRRSWSKTGSGSWLDAAVDAFLVQVETSDITSSEASPNSVRSARFSDRTITLTNNQVIVDNLQQIAADAQFESFDKIQILISSNQLNGTWRVIKTVGLTETQTILNVNITDLIPTQEIVFYNNLCLPGMKNLVPVDFGGTQNLVGYGLPGFSSVNDGPWIARAGVSYLTTNRISSSNGGFMNFIALARRVGNTWLPGIEGFDDPTELTGCKVALYRCDPTVYETVLDNSSNTLHIPLGGQLLITGTIVVQDGIALIQNPSGDVPTLLQGKPYTDDSGPGTGIRAEFRQTVNATVSRGSDIVNLSYANGNPAYIADRWMIAHEMTLSTVAGTGVVWRIEPLGQNNNEAGSFYPSRAYFPSNVFRLLEPWNGASGTGEFQLVTDSTSLFFGGSLKTNFFTYSINTVLKLSSLRSPIMALGGCRGRLVAICQSEQIVVLESPSGGIYVPRTFGQFAAYDVGLDVQATIRNTSHTCASPWTTNDAAGDLYFKGADEKAYKFDTVQPIPVSDQITGEYFRRQAEHSSTQIVQTPGQLYSQGVQFARMALKNDYHTRQWWQVVVRDFFALDEDGFPTDTTVQFQDVRPLNTQRIAVYPDRRSWVRQENLGEVDAACSAVSVEGEARLAYGSNGRIFIFGKSSIEGENSPEFCYTLGRTDQESLYFLNFPDTQFVPAAEGDEFLPSIYFYSDQMPVPNYRGLQFLMTGILVCKIPTDFNDASTIEWAEIICPTVNPSELPDDPQEQVLGFGDGSTTIFSYEFPSDKVPVRPASLVVRYTSGDVEMQITDDGSGGLVGDVESGGSINYFGGIISGYFSDAPDMDTEITAEWQRDPSLSLALRPQDTWTIAEGETYTLVFGARPWKIEMPSIQPSINFNWISGVNLNVDADASNPEATVAWPFINRIKYTRGKPGYDITTSTLSGNLTQANLQELRYVERYLFEEMSHEFTCEFSGIAPPDSDILFGPIWMEYYEDGNS